VFFAYVCFLEGGGGIRGRGVKVPPAVRSVSVYGSSG